MIICSNCAHECSDSMNFCPNCGKTLEKEQNISTQDTMVQELKEFAKIASKIALKVFKMVIKAFVMVIGIPFIKFMKFIGKLIKKHYFGFWLTVELLVSLSLYIVLTKTAIEKFGDPAYILVGIAAIVISCGIVGFTLVVCTDEYKSKLLSFVKNNDNKDIILILLGVGCLFIGISALALLTGNI